MRESFVIHRSFFEPVRELSNEEKGILYDMLCEYALNGVLLDNIPATVRLAFNFISPVIDWDYVKFQETVIRNQENGRKGGRPLKNPTEPKKPSGLSGLSKSNNKNPTEPKKPDSDSDSDSDNKEEKKKTNVFVRPTLIEIEECFSSKIKEEGKRLNAAQQAKQFEAHYESIGWMVGKNKMKNWKSAVAGWVNRTTEDKVSGTQQINGYKLQTEKAI
jgi:hypothetical protein